MKIVNITKEDLFYFLTNKDRIGQGCFGILSEYDVNTLIKIYYKDLINTYCANDINILDKEVSNMIEIRNLLNTLCPRITPEEKQNEAEIEELDRKKFEFLENEGYLKGFVYYRTLKVGVLINYYRGYVQLGKIYDNLSDAQRKYLICCVQDKLRYYMESNMYLSDLKEDNVLVNTETLEVAFIDLDDTRARYEEKNYIIEHNLYLEKDVNQRCKEMVRRLNKEYL